jgi:2-(1,2-epoxy-1,2-dihydrophenyl)acetyl-CoA isomerase
MDDQAPTLCIETQGRLRILTLNRPERMNALDPDLHHRLQDAVLEAAADQQIGALLLTGAGRGFCAGGDVRRKASGEPESVEMRADVIRSHGATVKALSGMAKPTIALINGAAAGSGLALALACDVRIALRSAVLRTAYAGVGLSGDLGITYFLTRIVGSARAAELMLLNERIDSARALDLGLVSRIVEDPDLETALDVGRALASGPTTAYRYMKQNLQSAVHATLDDVIEREAYNTARVVRTQDVAEATAAFREKRAPTFTGR